MRIIAIEEHFATAALSDATRSAPYTKALGSMMSALQGRDPSIEFDVRRDTPKVFDVGVERIADMDAGGIDLQVLGYTTPATEVLSPELAVSLARATNDELAEVVAKHPDRFAGFATLPTPDPEAAALELERAVTRLGFRGAMVNGHTHGRFLDDKSYWPLFETAERLGVPIYLHPTYPPASVVDAYYEGFNPGVNALLATGAWGWHVETGLHAMRLVLSGVFDDFPKLQIILGHMGEVVPFMLGRANRTLNPSVTKLQRGLAEYFVDNFYVTTSGFFSTAPFLCALLVLGVDRIIFSVDYPYSNNLDGRAFLDSLPLSAVDKAKVAHGNVERLLGLA